MYCKRKYPQMTANFRKKFFMVIFGHYRIFSLKIYFWALTDITGIFVDKGRADAFMN